MNRFIQWLPDRVDGRIRVVAWLSFVAEVVIIATGGAVRLTGSGLGCPTWPTCTADSLITTPEMGIHGLIEFGNRMMTGVVGLIALALFVLVWRIRAQRRDLFMLAFIVGVGIVAQAIVGGITVWTGLNPFIVGFHYVSSLLLVCVCAAFLVRMDAQPGPRELAVPSWYAGLTHATTGVLALTIVFGILTTGSGPHSGDAAAGRNGFESEVLEHVHAWPGYALLGLTVVLLVGAWRLRLPTLRWVGALLVVELVQIAVGLYQARNGLPPLAVGVHMVLAALTAASMTVVVLHLKRPAVTDAAPAAAPVAASAR
ncbi:COX15/CtaA family protein [Agromyces humi]|uniref:COX15/CtaA family protein n=1 Tax=Agromyces humi TaxID=1766800 RepID=UPI001359BBCB|nr:COX15/CtaA family protein [Agromyces humi]